MTTEQRQQIIHDGQAILDRRTQYRLHALRELGTVVAAVFRTPADESFTPRRGISNPARIAAQYLANEAGYTCHEISRVYGGDRRTVFLAVQTAKRALRLAEILDALRVTLHKHSEFFASQAQLDELPADIRRIIYTVADEAAVHPHDLLSRKRQQDIADARFLAMHLIRALVKPQPSIKDIARIFNRAPGDVRHALKRVKDMLATQPDFHHRLRNLETAITAKLNPK